MQPKIVTILLSLLITWSTWADNDKYVNLFMGTSGDHGQVTPAATVPFGMIAVCPDSDPGQHGGYDYAVPEISGISINRVSGVGCSGVGGNISVRPAAPDETLSIVKESERAHPGYYETLFSNGVKGSFTATHNMAVERYQFPGNSKRRLFINFVSSFEKHEVSSTYKVVDPYTIEGYVNSPTACARGRYKLWFLFKTDTPFHVEKMNEEDLLIAFQPNTKSAEVRITVSPLDQVTAREEAEMWASKSFRKIHREARSQWREVLGRIDVSGADEEIRTLFYTSLYRVYLSPMDVTSHDGRYLGTDGNIYHADGFRYYSSWSMWDTFRTKFPLLVITEPETMSDIALSLLHQFRTGKRDWATPFESAPTVRTEHSQIMLLDAYRKGIQQVDFTIGYEGMKSEAATALPMRSPDQKMETAYDLWAMGEIAGIMGKHQDAKQYHAFADSLFSDTWKRTFMHITPGFEKMGDNGLYQGSRWQYRWAAPQYIDKMIAWVGKESLDSQLSYFFDNDLFNQGNEPDIHTPYLFNLTGSPEKSQQLVRNLITRQMTHRYGGNAAYAHPYYGKAFRNHVEGYMPEMDEDDGTMSAWYIFGAMGLYPLLVGSDRYELVSPLFDTITLHSGDARFTIRTRGRQSPDDLIKSILLNGKPLKGYTLQHDSIAAGGELTFIY